MGKQYYVYILTNFKNNVFYTGITSDLLKRVWQHKEKLVDGFTQRYNLYKLVYFEVHGDVQEAILREKKIKKWKKEWKVELVEKENPLFKDLYLDLAE